MTKTNTSEFDQEYVNTLHARLKRFEKSGRAFLGLMALAGWDDDTPQPPEEQRAWYVKTSPELDALRSWRVAVVGQKALATMLVDLDGLRSQFAGALPYITEDYTRETPPDQRDFIVQSSLYTSLPGIRLLVKIAEDYSWDRVLAIDTIQIGRNPE